MALDNSDIAELLTREAEEAQGTLKKALKRAARAALLWPREAADLLSCGESLTELPGIGPFLERKLLAWFEKPPKGLEPPPLRRSFLTLSRARETLKDAPGWRENYRGDLQMHSNWSDGAATIEEMAQAGNQLGYDYIAITDHSKGLKIAGGISEKELKQQAVEIDEANRILARDGGRMRVLKSLELNLNPRGEGDMAAGALKQLDLVVGSFHSKLREKEDQTDRYLLALSNPFVAILGHPVGRIYNHRIGLHADWRRVCSRAAELDKALEVDCYPDRQDLSLELLVIARSEGTRIAIDTDAHAPGQLAFAELGLAAAKMAGIEPSRIVNFLSRDKLIAWASRS